MAKKISAAERVRALCLALPDTEESLSFGKPHYKVSGKIFAGCEEIGGEAVLGFKLEKPAAAALIAADERCCPAPYVGKHGWVAMKLVGAVDWSAVRGYVETSYALIAPKKKATARAKAPAPRRAKSSATSKRSKRAPSARG
ncbi:MAG: MmcQ/YjbR family DNA-binding protein [Planctomycetes bacterium]|nr:MmcQ/YjbR family DNA-binding protein [Planctomycetota bacterium]